MPNKNHKKSKTRPVITEQSPPQEIVSTIAVKEEQEDIASNQDNNVYETTTDVPAFSVQNQVQEQQESTHVPVVEKQETPSVINNNSPQTSKPERKKCPLAAFHPYEGYDCLTCRQLNGEDISKFFLTEREKEKEKRKREKTRVDVPKVNPDAPYTFPVGADGLKAREDFIPSWMKSSMKKK